MADINVLMVVDTKNIKSGKVDDNVYLIDDNSDKEGNKDFTINAEAGKTVQFRITAIDMTTEVAFKGFAWTDAPSKGEHCFNELPDETNNWCSKTQGDAGDQEDFSITFSVDGNSDSPFTLDPRIKIKGG